MANGDVALEVLIKSVLDATGYRMNEAEAKKLQAGLAGIGQAHEEGAKQAEKSEISHRSLHKIIHLIAHEAGPAMGAALATAAAVGFGGLGFAIMAVKGLFEWMHRVKEKSEEVKLAAAGAWIAIRIAADDAAKSGREFWESLQTAKDKSEELKTSFEGSLKVLDAMVDAHKKILDALEKEQIAEAKGDKVKEAAIKKRFEDLKREYDITAESMKLEKLRDDLTNRKFVLGPKLKDTAVQAEADLEEEKEKQSAIDAAQRMNGPDGKPKDRAKLLAAANEAKERIPDAEKFMDSQRHGFGPDSVNAKNAAFVLEHLQKQVAEFNQYEKDKDAVDRHDKAVERLTTAKDEAVKVLKENNAAVKDETEQVKTGEEILKVHRDAARQQKAIETVGAAGGYGNAGNIIAAGVAAEAAIGHGQKMTQAMATQIQTMHALFEAVGGNATLMIQTVRQHLAHSVTQAQEIKVLQQQVANLASSQMRGSRTTQ